MSKPIVMEELIPGLGLSNEKFTDCYVYILGRYLVIRQEMMDLSEQGVGYNVLKHNPPVVEGKPGPAPTFVNPNLEVVYSEAWLLVDENTPVIIEIPQIPDHLYYTGQIADEWAEIVTNINERNYPEKPYGKYAICLRGSNPTIPADCLRVDIPSKKAKFLFRVEIRDDLERALALQHACSVASTGTPRPSPAVPIQMFKNDALPGAEIFGISNLDLALEAADACPHSTEYHMLLRKLAGIVGENEKNFKAVDKAVREVAVPMFWDWVKTFGDTQNGWSSTRQYVHFGADFRFRCIANMGGIWWNSSKEAVYFMLHTDADGNDPEGNTKYTLTFAGDALPGDHVDGYWSATMYAKPSYMLVTNPLARYKIGYMSNLKKNADGGFTIYISPDKPKEAPEENWLPSPAGQKFVIDFRTYLPKQDVLDGQWCVPPIIKSLKAF